jgi:CIC family chloride channel protein
MRIFGREDTAEIAVLRGGKFIGVVKRKDVIEAYNHEILKREAAAGLLENIKFSPLTKAFDIAPGYKIMEIAAPARFWGQSLRELHLKARFGIDVLVIKRKYPPHTMTIPAADTVIIKDDQLVIAGLEKNLKNIFNARE